ncbi:hypothetical protein L6R53_12480 [Myxococcota bacterium]|nr:hypothetical protein [Myxococcota bacterium]
MADGPPSSSSSALGLRASQAALARRREEVQARQAEGLATVDRLVRQQREVSTALQAELAQMRQGGEVLDEIEARSRESGLLAALTRQLSRRRTMLERRSVTEGLIARYQAASLQLRRATAFTDELRLCAADLQHQVDELHQELATASRLEREGAERVRAQEAEAAALEARASALEARASALEARAPALEARAPALEAGPGDLGPEERQRRLDRLTFSLRNEAVDLELHMARARLCRQHIEPARQLRDTVLSLHEDMARFVTAATATLDSAGRRIQALGMAADAPVVVAELQQSLAELGLAMEAAEEHVRQSQALLTEVLPALSRRLEAQGEVEGEALTGALELVSRERARALAEQALREAAEAEVDQALGRTL